MGNVRRQTWLLTYVLLPLVRALDWLLCKRHFGLRLLDPNRIITRRLDPRRLMQKARAIAGDGPFHLPEPLIEDRLRRAQAALRDANLKGLGAPGDLVVGLPAVAVLERRLTRALVADLRVTRAVALDGAYFAAPPGEDALVITGPPRSGTTLLLELLACDEETWRPLTGPEALVPGAVDGDAVQRHRRDDEGDEDAEDGDHVRAAAAHRLAEEAGHDGPRERCQRHRQQ